MRSDARRILVAQGLRALAYGFGSVLLGASLEARGWSTTRVGLLLTFVLAGTVLASLLVGTWGDRLGRRRAYAGLFVTLALAGAVFGLTDQLWLLAAGGADRRPVDRGRRVRAATSLEQPMLARSSRGQPAPGSSGPTTPSPPWPDRWARWPRAAPPCCATPSAWRPPASDCSCSWACCRRVVPGRLPPGRAVRAAAHHDVQPPALERAAGRGRLRPQLRPRRGPAPRSPGAEPDGRPHPPGLRDGPRPGRGAHSRGRQVALGLPFLLAGVVEGTYDLVLWRWFRTVPLAEGESGQRRDHPRVDSSGTL